MAQDSETVHMIGKLKELLVETANRIRGLPLMWHLATLISVVLIIIAAFLTHSHKDTAGITQDTLNALGLSIAAFFGIILGLAVTAITFMFQSISTRVENARHVLQTECDWLQNWCYENRSFFSETADKVSECRSLFADELYESGALLKTRTDEEIDRLLDEQHELSHQVSESIRRDMDEIERTIKELKEDEAKIETEEVEHAITGIEEKVDRLGACRSLLEHVLMASTAWAQIMKALLTLRLESILRLVAFLSASGAGAAVFFMFLSGIQSSGNNWISDETRLFLACWLIIFAMFSIGNILFALLRALNIIKRGYIGE